MTRIALPSIGCAGWSISPQEQTGFPAEGSHLERYALRLPAVEINSSFYRPHRNATYTRWATTVPTTFRFAVKVPKAITHEARLVEPDGLLDAFLAQISGLGSKLGVLLVQLPPSLRFDSAVADNFFRALRERHVGPVACEPRHPTWFGPEAMALMEAARVARVAADPAPVAGADLPGGWKELAYYRLHGSPEMYYSAYTEQYLARLALVLTRKLAEGADVWCIFDNTAAGFAISNALALLKDVARPGTHGKVDPP